MFRWLRFDRNNKSVLDIANECKFQTVFKRLVANRSGWILAEALIGTTILVVGIMAIMVANIQTTKTAKFSDNTAQATYIAQQKIEALKRTYDVTNNPVEASALTACSTVDGIFTVECSIPKVTTPVSGLNLVPVSIKVKWTDAASVQENSVTLTTYYFHKNRSE